MTINISPDLRIVSEPHNWIVQQRKVWTTGKIRWVNLGYHANLERAVIWLLKSKLDLLSNNNEVELREIITAVRSAKGQLLLAIGQLGKVTLHLDTPTI